MTADGTRVIVYRQGRFPGERLGKLGGMMPPRSGWCGLLLLTQVACASANWAEPVGDFKKSVDASVAVVAGYYDNLNAFERRVYLADALADPAKRIGTTATA